MQDMNVVFWTRDIKMQEVEMNLIFRVEQCQPSDLLRMDYKLMFQLGIM
jgi:hypothetical protein